MKVSEVNNKEVYIVVTCFQQYAEGVTGCTRNGSVFSGETSWLKKGDSSLKEALKELKKSRVNRKGGVNVGYGSVGCIQYSFKVMKGVELKEWVKDNYNHYYVKSYQEVKSI